MTKGAPRNLAASVRQRLQNLARNRREDFQLVLSRYALERLLHRIDQSAYGGRLVIKGAMLFQLWTDQPYRPTRDIDFLAYGEYSVDHWEAVERRRTAVPVAVPLALTSDFHNDSSKQKQWKAFASRGALADVPPLPDLLERLRSFLMPPTEAVWTGSRFRQRWLPPGPWQP